ncbi:5-amino-6-(5-phospho-D-ribitylamino)uracil phosphatase YigB [Vibrio cincinnatiensis]|jgi:putative hydrolase of the HAD superfamily|uniref:Putative hydrolase of the HAD superfamily n=1 Tax=Vibrio cincinnatiensis DSM 19608 TaxID=1123491 RepID=A0A1T4R407_VIBCI|nr:5-amino-6-(5-phospho-D-ribitylamino)uracil phosphatase YigB [Vibrio cincinnatiensis]MCG3722309.1 5-amino-6-(5-phospho-D-ribitylamino)uracil phosphatase YigB [Vibrio cincinnatiensis]MCG3725330.1 5-amino-6-(5-phospho-D-ribitylamino)uracil phosphatase YigB [Vibrio cincinnatiensis]MCG3746489.1 5-amino-6-(5-phospho-D-ribitylamino)uracil phosphatase YigB [Vibrio cincinnatiensis]SKA10381.1 putative hydrolase of the HAD superfamily [Vibrio cincinnatiensis DSM 19608]SUP47370.1 hydrolase [Vibrio cinc
MHFYRQLQPIQAMTFDLDDTLYDNHPVIRHLEQQIAQWLYQHHPVTATQSMAWWNQLKWQLASEDPWLNHDVTLWRFEQIRQGLHRLGYSPSQAKQAAEEAIEEVLRLRNLVTVPTLTHQVLRSLAQKRPLVAITNGNVDVEKIGLSDYFQRVLKAGPDGRAKPYPDLFCKARQFLQLPASAILHVGDHLVTDVQGAKENGFQACWYNDHGHTLRASRDAKVLPDVEVNSLSQLSALIY